MRAQRGPSRAKREKKKKANIRPKRLERMSSTDLIPGLHRALEELTENPPSSVPSPRETPKRASVALVVRVRCFLSC